MVANLIIWGVLSMQTTCKLRGGGGQKSGNFANVIYECPLTKFLTRVLAMVTFPVGIGHSIPWSPHVSLQPFKSLVSTPSLILLEANRV